MARPKKQGLDYFPLDTQFLSDIKVRKIMRAQGTNAIPVLISLLCNIYRDEGYYILRDDEVSFLIADEIGVKEEYVNEIIDKAIQVGFFDKYQYQANNILTSKGIQKRFFDATERRKDVVFNEEYIVNVNNNSINVNNNSINVNRSTQSKVKKSKVKNIPPNPQMGESDFIPETLISEKEEKGKKIPAKKEKFDFSFVDIVFLSLVKDFIEYRKKIKKPFKTERGIECFYRELVKLSNNNLQKAKSLIEYAKDKEWQTVYPIKNEKNTNTTSEQSVERKIRIAENLERIAREQESFN